MMHELEQLFGQEGAACLVVIVGAVTLLLLLAVGSWVVRAVEQASPAAVQRRAVELRRQQVENNIAEIGEATRAAIREAAERRRRDASR